MYRLKTKVRLKAQKKAKLLFLKEHCNQGSVKYIFKNNKIRPPSANLNHLPKALVKMEDYRAKV